MPDPQTGERPSAEATAGRLLEISDVYYAGPVYEYAPSSCVEWGGSAAGTTWTSGWTHCG